MTHHQHVGDPMFWIVLISVGIVVLFVTSIITPKQGLSPISIPWFRGKEKKHEDNGERSITRHRN